MGLERFVYEKSMLFFFAHKENLNLSGDSSVSCLYVIYLLSFSRADSIRAELKLKIPKRWNSFVAGKYSYFIVLYLITVSAFMYVIKF